MKRMSVGLIMLFSLMLLFSGVASAASVTEATYLTPSEVKENMVTPFAEIGPTYPGTNITMKPGDVIHNPKSVSTFLVGHVAIVGNDLLLRHAHPLGPGITEGITSYVSRFDVGDLFTILRPKNGIGPAAATWSQNNIGNVFGYNFLPGLGAVGPNYCSKFVWQAYWFGAQKELTADLPYSVLLPVGLLYVYPFEIKNSNAFVTMGYFYK